MADTLTIISNFISSPSGRLAAGLALATGVAKGFKHLGDLTSEKTNKEIARWLRVKHFESGIVTEEAVHWPDTFAKVFDRAFGEKHLSWRCFGLSSVTSLSLACLGYIFSIHHTAAIFS